MSDTKRKQFGVWMDSHQATVIGRKNVDNGEFVILGHAKNENTSGNSNENAANNSERTQLHKFFKEISAHMQNAEELHVTGTGTVQEQFKKYMAETPQFKHAIVKESTANKMSEEKLIAFFNDKFPG